jgi:uncharacterized cupredoxin-like copper-binding protein
MRTIILLLLTATSACAEGYDASPPRRDAGEEPADAGQRACSATIQLLDIKLDPKTLELDGGEITLCAENNGETPHDLCVRDDSGETLGKTKPLQPGERDRFSVTLEAGAYTVYCSFGGHESLGMKGTLTVR